MTSLEDREGPAQRTYRWPPEGGSSKEMESPLEPADRAPHQHLHVSPEGAVLDSDLQTSKRMNLCCFQSLNL